MFNFFKKKKDTEPSPDDENTEEDIVASLTYYIKKDGLPYVDVNMMDYDKSTIILLGDMLVGIQSGAYLPATLEVIRDGLIEHEKPELYLTLATTVGAMLIGQASKESSTEGPCINPSDVLP